MTSRASPVCPHMLYNFLPCSSAPATLASSLLPDQTNLGAWHWCSRHSGTLTGPFLQAFAQTVLPQTGYSDRMLNLQPSILFAVTLLFFSVALISFSHTRQHTPYWMHCFSLPGRRWALPGRDCCLYHPPLYTSTYNTPKIVLRKECESSLVFITCDLTAEIYLERKVSRETVEIFLWEIKQKNSGTEKI